MIKRNQLVFRPSSLADADLVRVRGGLTPAPEAAPLASAAQPEIPGGTVSVPVPGTPATSVPSPRDRRN